MMLAAFQSCKAHVATRLTCDPIAKSFKLFSQFLTGQVTR